MNFAALSLVSVCCIAWMIRPGQRSRPVILALLPWACIAGYVAITFLGWQMKTGREFLMLAALVGTVQGGTQALSRSLFSRMIPAARSGEFFGFFAIFEKFAGIFGPLLFSVAIYATGSTRTAILTTLVFFIAGGLLLLKVDVARGEREAA